MKALLRKNGSANHAYPNEMDTIRRNKTYYRKVGDKNVVILTGHRVINRKATPRRKTYRSKNMKQQIMVLKEVDLDSMDIPYAITAPPPPPPFIGPLPLEVPSASPLISDREVPDSVPKCM